MSFTRMTLLAAALLLCSLITANASGEWEHEVVYDIKEFDDPYSLNLANAADDTMKFCFHLTDEASAHGVEEVEGNCHADEDAPTAISPSATVTEIVSGTTYQLTMDSDTWFSVFNIKFPANGLYAFFAQHEPSEFVFEGGSEIDILKDGDNHDLAPAWDGTTVAASARKTPWGNTMAGCFAVWCVTLSGLVLIINTQVWHLIKPYALMFASGTLMSTAFALILFEATHLIAIDADEGLAAGRWTAMIMCGFITSPVIALCLRQFLPVDDDAEIKITKLKAITATDDCCDSKDPKQQIRDLEAAKAKLAIDDACCAGPADGDNCEKLITNANVRSRFLMSLIVGDFFHNFTDGIFIGAAFQCNTSLAWKVVAVTVGHEIPQELADFAVLTNSLGFSTAKALAYNVICGMSVMLGGIAIMAAEISNLDTGMLLAYGAGSYLYCATVHMFAQGSKDRFFDAKKLLVFAVGAIAIGLILLDHEHCEAPALESAAEADPHAGHGH